MVVVKDAHTSDLLRTSLRVFPAVLFALALQPTLPALALDVPEAGATWATNANALGATGTNVVMAFVEVDIDGVSGPPYVYRINPYPTNGWEGGYWPPADPFGGKTITYYDDGTDSSTSYSSHATGVGRSGVGNDMGWGSLSYRGIALGCVNVPNYEANWFIKSCMASNVEPVGKCFSFAFTTTTTDQRRLTAQMDRLVQNYGKIFVQGVRPRPALAEYGGNNPAGMGAAYNIISVGCCESGYTNWSTSQYGPSYAFGTAKPDLLTAVYSESEAAGRGAADAALLVDQAIKAGFSNGSDPRVVKAIMIAGARKTYGWDKGNTGAADDHSVPYDYHAGAGIVHCLNNYGIMYGGEITVNSTNVRPAWDLDTISTSAQINVYYIDLPQSNLFISAALVWHRAVGAGYTNLQNLNLHLYSVTGTNLNTRLDWSTSQVDSVEYIWHEATSTGRYGIVVDGQSIATDTTYAVAFRFDTTTNLPMQDADADGVPDTFERQNFTEIYFYNATNDPDTDGMDNYAEYVSDTLPTDSNSFFGVTIRVDSNSIPVVSFNTSTARQYAVEYNSQYVSNFSAWAVATTNAFYGSGGQTNWVDDGSETEEHPSNTPARIYRAHVTVPQP